MKRDLVTDTELAGFLADNAPWSGTVRDGLEIQIVYRDFKGAFAAMTAMAQVSEDLQHHPEWFNVYNKLNIRLITHETVEGVEGVTPLDLEWIHRTKTSWSMPSP